jgi:hypothetical protein
MVRSIAHKERYNFVIETYELTIIYIIGKEATDEGRKNCITDI